MRLCESDMTQILRFTLIGALALGQAGPVPAAGSASDQAVIAVLSSDSSHYLEALDGFNEAFGKPVLSFNIKKELPQIAEETKLVVAFGTQAALWRYRPGMTVIACMAPGADFKSKADSESRIEVGMMPGDKAFYSALKDIQPSIKRVAVFWLSSSMNEYAGELQRDAAFAGIQITPLHLNALDELPDGLREIQYTADAIMLLPDPILVNPQSFATIKDFSWSNHFPFYAPTSGLVEIGATASISSSFREIGRTAAASARKALRGEKTGGIAYSDKVEMTVNLTAAKKSGLNIDSEVLKKADKVFP